MTFDGRNNSLHDGLAATTMPLQQQQQQQHHPSAMERVLFNLHQQLCTQALRKTSARTRSILEHALLVLAVCCFGVLLLAHLSFVYRGGPPLMSPHPVKSSLKYKIPSTCLTSIPNFTKTEADVTHLSIFEDDEDDDDGPTGKQPSSFVFMEQRNTLDAKETCSDQQEALYNATPTIFSYSSTKGYLLLSPDTCHERNLTIQHVAVSKRDIRCFGEPFLQTIVHRLTSPETVMINWILGLANHDGRPNHAPGPLFVYNPRTDTIIDLEEQFQSPSTGQYFHYYSDSYGYYSIRKPLYYSNRQNHHQTPLHHSSWHRQFLSKLAVVIKTSFLFFTTTTLISFTLRETQDRMLDFTHQLQAQVRLRQSVSGLVVTHLLENLVFVPQMIGLCFFLTEFYHGDKFLAFMVLSLVWLCEVFSVVSLRSSQGTHFFPRIFFLLFSLFHYYLFSFPFGFAYTALTSTVLFMAHSMVFFWHRYELPAVAHGHVSLSNPRMTNNNGSHHHTPTRPSSIPVLSSADRRINGRSGNMDVQSPQISLSPRVHHHQYTIVRQPSQTSGSGSASGGRQTGSSVVFQHGSTDEDDRDESYLFFMNGEVVMHRRPPSSASLRSGMSSIYNDDNISTNDAANRIESPGHGEELESIGSSNSMNDALETSALQAIMEVSMHVNGRGSREFHETPRVENLFRRFADEDGQTCAGVAPDIPSADDLTATE